MFVAALITASIAASAVALYRTSFRIESRCWLHALCRKNTRERVVALTFDDGTDVVQTPRVLDILHTRGVEACFFVVGDRADGDILRRMVDEGHVVGNHTLHHAGFGPFASARRMVEEAQICDARIAAVTGLAPRLFRPPFGVSNPMIGRMVRQRGYTVIGWSIRSLDTRKGSRHEVVERIRRQLHPGAVILLHDNREGASELLEELLDVLQREHYTVRRVDKLFETEAYENQK